MHLNPCQMEFAMRRVCMYKLASTQLLQATPGVVMAAGKLNLLIEKQSSI